MREVELLAQAGMIEDGGAALREVRETLNELHAAGAAAGLGPSLPAAERARRRAKAKAARRSRKANR